MSGGSLLKRVLRGARVRAAGPPHAMDPTVTPEDVRFAYRLVLGRHPDPDGWHTYTAMAGSTDVHELTGALMSSEEFRATPMYRALSRSEHDELVLVEVEGFRLFVSPHDLLNRALVSDARYEPHLTAAIRDALQPGSVFCDVGANIGYYSNLAAHVVGPTGSVVAFEALSRNVQLIRRSALVNGHRTIVVHPSAVSDQPSVFRYVRAQGTNGYIAPIDPADEAALTDPDLELVQGARLDDVDLPARIDVLKIDVEGSEWLALRGAQATIERTRPTIFSELCIGQLQRTSGVDGGTYLGMLRDWDYDIDVLGFGGEIVPFGTEVDAAVRHAQAQPESHVDVRCTPR